MKKYNFSIYSALPIKYIGILLLTLIMFFGAARSYAQQREFSTFYPSPTGQYFSLKAESVTFNSSAEPNCDIGTIFLDGNDNNLLKYCVDDGTDVGTWISLGAGGGAWKYFDPTSKDIVLIDQVNMPNIEVGIGTKTPEFKLTVDGSIDSANNDSGILSIGKYGTGRPLNIAGAKTKFIWYPKRAAFRAGYVSGDKWDDANLGGFSVSFGNDNLAFSTHSSILGGQGNEVKTDASVVLGGFLNKINTAPSGGLPYSVILGGQSNIINSQSFIGGGLGNESSADYAGIGGGQGNRILRSAAEGGPNAEKSIIGGGGGLNDGNTIDYLGSYGTIIGGIDNNLKARYSIIFGGIGNSTKNVSDSNYAKGSVIGGGYYNKLVQKSNMSPSYSVIDGGKENMAYGSYSIIGGGMNNTIWESLGMNIISGGLQNYIYNSSYSIIAGGKFNRIKSSTGSIGGGRDNVIELNAASATIAGGYKNIANNGYVVGILGGDDNYVDGTYTDKSYSAIAGGESNVAGGCKTGDTDCTVLTKHEYTYVGGGYGNYALNDSVAVSGGRYNRAYGIYSTIGGGYNNTDKNLSNISNKATIKGGYNNLVYGDYGVIVGGKYNKVGESFIGGGYGHNFNCKGTAGFPPMIGGGFDNQTGSWEDNKCELQDAIVPGGRLISMCSDSFALGGSENWTRGAYNYIGGYKAGIYRHVNDSFSWSYDPTGSDYPGISNNFDRAPRFLIFPSPDDSNPANVGRVLIGTTTLDSYDQQPIALKIHGGVRISLENYSDSTKQVWVDSNGILYKNSSSQRYKKDIVDLAISLDKILQLRPVSFTWKTSGEKDFGLIAEEVEQSIPSLVLYDRDSQPDGVRYSKVPIYLIELVKTNDEIIEKQQRTLDDLDSQIADLKSKLPK